MRKIALFILTLFVMTTAFAAEPSTWTGKQVAFLGGSMTAPNNATHRRIAATIISSLNTISPIE